LLEKTYNKVYKKALREQQYDAIVNFIDSYFRYAKARKEIDVPLYKQVYEMITDQVDYAIRSFVTQVREIETNKLFLERALQEADADLQESDLLEYVDLLDPSYNDDYSRYLYLKNLSYQLSGNEKIEKLKEALDLLSSASKPDINYYEERVFCLGTIGLEYFLMGNYQKAHQYYKQAVDEAEEHFRKMDLSVLFNFISNLIKLRQYKKVIELIERYESQITKNKKVMYRMYCLRAMCHLFQQEPDRAYKTIPFDIKKRPKPQYFYYRFIYAIIYYLWEDYEAGKREIYNFYQTLQNNSQLEVDVLPVVRFFRRFFHLASQDEVAGRKLSNLQKDIEAYRQQAPPRFKDYLPLLWLNQKVEKMTS
jgi:hypothetical protein